MFAVVMASSGFISPGIWLVLASLGLCALLSAQPGKVGKLATALLIALAVLTVSVGGRELFAVLHPCGDIWWFWVC